MKPEHEQYILENTGRKSAEAIAKDLGIKERKVKRFLERQRGKNDGPERLTASSFGKKNNVLSVCLIIILGFCAYGNSIQGEFLYDDETLVTDNIFITDWAYLPDIFKEDIGAGAGKESNPYRPFQVLTYMADYSLWKLDPRGYHLTNVVCHILTALSVYWLISLLFKDWRLSLISSLFFVVHPIHTQAVSYIAGRADCLASLFMLMSFILYVKQAFTKKALSYLLMLLSFGLAILSRENSLILPAMVLLYHYAFKRKILVKEFVSLLAMAFAYVLLRAVFFSHLMPETPLHKTTFLARLPGFFVALTQYVQLLMMPFNLHMEYGDKLFALSDPRAITGILLLVCFVAVIVRARKRNPLVSFAVLWFLITLAPSSNIYPINAYMAEHWLYLPSIGLFLLLAKGLCLVYNQEKFRKYAIIVCGGWLCFYAFLTFRQNALYWRDPLTFYQRTIQYAPDSFNAHNNLGKLYHDMGREEEAVRLFARAIEINPREANAYNNLAAVSYEPGKNEEYIIGLLRKSVTFDPYHAKARYNLGKLYKDIGENAKAIPEFEKAIELNPNYVAAYEKLGTVYGKVGRREEAVIMLKRSVEIDPSYADGYHSLGSLYNDMGRKEESIRYLEKAVMINPGYGAAHTNLAMAYYYNGQYDLAAQHCRKAQDLGFEVPPAFLKVLESHEVLDP